MLNSPFSVYVEEPARSLDESMNAIRSWLDHNKIQPIELNTTTQQAYRPLPLQHRHRSAQPLHAMLDQETLAALNNNQNGAASSLSGSTHDQIAVELAIDPWPGGDYPRPVLQRLRWR
jgi:hypothetical protein